MAARPTCCTPEELATQVTPSQLQWLVGVSQLVRLVQPLPCVDTNRSTRDGRSARSHPTNRLVTFARHVLDQAGDDAGNSAQPGGTVPVNWLVLNAAVLWQQTHNEKRGES